MAASVNDKFSKVSTGVRPTTTTVASIRSVSGTSLICDDLTGWDTDAAVHFSTYQVDGQGDVVAGTQTDMKGTVSGNTISNIIITGGTDTGNAVGDIVQQLPTARYAKDLADGLLVAHDQDGTLKAGAVDNSAVIADGIVTNAKLATGAGEPGGEWQTYTPTLAGWSGTPTVVARYKQIGKIVYVTIGVDGTSNSVTTTISLPVASQGAIFTLCRTSDGSTDRVGIIWTSSPGSTLTSRLGFQNGSGSSLFTAWAASGSKVVSPTTFMYEAA